MAEVKGATDAMRIARLAASEAGVIFPFVSGARKEGNVWIVDITSLAGSYEARIVATSGEVSEWKPVKTFQGS
jgi:hypothetical protein